MTIFKSMDTCYKFFNRQLNAEFLKAGYGEMTFNSYQYLIAIYKLHKDGDRATVTEIAHRLSVKKSSVVEMVKTLLKHEYVIKKENLNDKRRFTLELSDKGFDMMKIEAAFSEKMIKFFYDPLEPEEAEQFEKILGKVAQHLEDEVFQ